MHCDGYCGKLHSRIDELESRLAELTQLLEAQTLCNETKANERLINERQQKIHNNPSPRNHGWKRPRLMDSTLLDGEELLERLLQSDDYGFNAADEDQEESRTPGYPFSEDELMGLGSIYSDTNVNEEAGHSLMNEVASTPQRDGVSPMSSNALVSPPPQQSRTREPKRKVQRYNKSARAARTQKATQPEPSEDKASSTETASAVETPRSDRRESTQSPPSNVISPPNSGSIPSRKQRPMFVLASSYLNKHTSGGNRSTTSSPELTHQAKSTQHLAWGHTPPEDAKLPTSFATAISDVDRITTDT